MTSGATSVSADPVSDWILPMKKGKPRGARLWHRGLKRCHCRNSPDVSLGRREARHPGGMSAYSNACYIAEWITSRLETLTLRRSVRGWPWTLGDFIRWLGDAYGFVGWATIRSSLDFATWGGGNFPGNHSLTRNQARPRVADRGNPCSILASKWGSYSNVLAS